MWVAAMLSKTNENYIHDVIGVLKKMYRLIGKSYAPY
jgi:hypothetical protein